MDNPNKIKNGILKPECLMDGEIDFENVTFTYPTKPDVIVLNNFNVKIKKGETFAIVG